MEQLLVSVINNGVIVLSAIAGGVDYDSKPHSIMLPAGMTSIMLNVPIFDDDTLEDDETFTLTINPSNDYMIRRNRNETRVTIKNDDCK